MLMPPMPPREAFPSHEAYAQAMKSHDNACAWNTAVLLAFMLVATVGLIAGVLSLVYASSGWTGLGILTLGCGGFALLVVGLKRLVSRYDV